MTRIGDLFRPAPRRGVRYYRGASRSALTNWFGGNRSADADLWGDLAELRARSREMVRDNALAASLARVWVENVIGPNGLTPHPLVYLPDQSLNQPIVDEQRAAWREWGQRASPTMDRRLSWYDVECLIARTEFVDGEFLAIEHVGASAPNRYGYALQLLDPDQLDETLNAAPTKTRGEIRMGVEVDGWGNPQVYHLLTRHPSDIGYGTREYRQVPAADVLHYYEVTRPGLTRGTPRLAPLLHDLKLADQYDEAELFAALSGAAKPVYFTQGEDSIVEGEHGPGTAGAIPDDIGPGQRELLPKGIGVHQLDPNHPTSAYPEFKAALNLRMTSGVGIAYHVATGDLRGATYGSLRVADLQQRNVFRREHTRFGTHVSARVWRQLMRQGAFHGALSVAAGRQRDVEFRGRGWPWLDPLKELQATEKELALRLTTRSRIVAELGSTFDEVLRDWDQDERLAADWGVALPDPAVQAAPPAAPTTTEDGNDSDSRGERGADRSRSAVEGRAVEGARDVGGDPRGGRGRA